MTWSTMTFQLMEQNSEKKLKCFDDDRTERFFDGIQRNTRSDTRIQRENTARRAVVNHQFAIR